MLLGPMLLGPMLLAFALCCPHFALGVSAAPRQPLQAKAQPSADQEALALLDADAGLVISVGLSQFQSFHELVVACFPEARGAINLASLGATAMLGFHPFLTNAWIEKGFDAQSKILVQVGAIDRPSANEVDRGRGTALWRTRIVLRAADTSKARAALSEVRFRERVRIEHKSDKSFGKILQLSDRASSKLMSKLQGAGVFLVAKPAPLPGLLIMSQRHDLFVIDLLAPYGPADASWRWGKQQALLLQMIERRPNLLGDNMPGARALLEAPIGLWLRPALAGEAIAASELDGLAANALLRRRPHCEPFAKLARQSEFRALSLRAELHARKLDLDLRWHLKPGSQLPELLSTESAPLLASANEALRAIVRLAHLGSLRTRKGAPVARTWDLLWDSAKLCGPGGKSLALAVAWPEIAGLFLDELSALHPQARVLIDSLGSVAISAHGGPEEQEIVAEAWIRRPGDQVAKGWLKSLFGHERRAREPGAQQRQGNAFLRWGRGRMRPYAIAQDAGSVVGAFLGPGHQNMALASSGTRQSTGSKIFELRAQPSALRPELLRHPLGTILASWRQLSAELALVKDQLRFTIALEKD